MEADVSELWCHSQALDDSQSTEPEVVSKDREVAAEERGGPLDFGEDKDNDLEDDEQSVEHSPECTGGLVRNGAITVAKSEVSQTSEHSGRTEHIPFRYNQWSL